MNKYMVMFKIDDKIIFGNIEAKSFTDVESEMYEYYSLLIRECKIKSYEVLQITKTK